jgi:hypothetical protein
MDENDDDTHSVNELSPQSKTTINIKEISDSTHIVPPPPPQSLPPPVPEDIIEAGIDPILDNSLLPGTFLSSIGECKGFLKNRMTL